MVGSIVLSVTFTINRFLLLRYSAAVMLNTSVTVIVVVVGVEGTPAELMAVMVSVAEAGVAGALKETVALVGPEGVTHRFPCTTPRAQPADGNSRVPAGACVTVKRSGVCAGTLGSVPVIRMLTSVEPTGTETGATLLATGGRITGAGLMVTVVTADVEAPIVLVAVTVTAMGVATKTPAGAVKLTVALVGPAGVITRLSRAGAPAWLIVQVSGVAGGTLGSEPVTLNEPGLPEITNWLGIGSTVGDDAAATVTFVVALEAPPQLVAVSVRLNVVETAT